ncbi:hypothetical protein DICPUDRAFT_159767 [Dictyostelium purpureum]|uniref:DUF4419 domain-containing protein n=1 Tax=Dictyostelium purpureum TaxID=5786 RepID=F1A4Y4_DICPU|nr:uncharacterized protein DICPUDRAFT_159767 [Dictyostelium purpureum]EGC28748.1 hypothetical protein DICPUDRAFT_159767 [Dictyostelium purpureum]|eukprot:XP_003294727.1 hypothetical protein DICPUDRAFT_159767 [Dictyostelium purpureum]
MTITFKVSDAQVNPVNNPREFDQKSLYEEGGRPGMRAAAVEKTIIKTSISNQSKAFGNNSLVNSVFTAYCQHHNLVLRPDDFWTAILIQLSLYINANSEQLRDKIVDFEGKRQLTVRGSGNLFTAPYEQMTLQMTREIEKNIKDPSIREWVMKKFSTTTDTDQLVSSITLMATMKNYFDFKMHLMCNLPSVTLEGDASDYIDIKNRISRLVEFDLKEAGNPMSGWLNYLNPIVDKLIETANGSPDTEWWNKIVNRVGGGSGPTYLSGWITAFCAFDAKGKYIMENKKEFKSMWGDAQTTEWSFIDTGDVIRGYVSCPVKINDNGKEYNTEFYAGHMAYSLSDDNCTIKPNLDWSIVLLD